jgi:hypothetical protein
MCSVRNHIENGRNSGSQGVNDVGITLGHHFDRRLGGPVERMRMDISFSDEGHQAFCQTIEVREIADAQPLTLHNTKPLLDLVHL